MDFVGTALLAVVVLLLCMGAAKFLVTPGLKWALTAAFTSLAGQSGTLRTLRRVISYPVVGLLSLQRRARRGDQDSRLRLALIDIAIGGVISGIAQGFLTTLIVLAAIAVLAVIGTALANV